MKLTDFRVNHPEYDDMGDAALATALHRKFYSDVPVGEFYKSVGLVDKSGPMLNPTGTGVENFRAGMGKAFTDVGRAIGQPFGFVSQEDIQAARTRDAPLMDTSAGMAGNIVGSAAAMAPTAFIPGANTLLGASLIGAGSGLALTPGTLGERAVSGVAGAAGGALGNVIGTGAGNLARKVTDRATNNIAPSVSADTLKNAASLQYKMARSAGVEISPSALERTGTAIRASLEQEGYRKSTAPKVFSALNELAELPKANLDDIEAVRRALSKAGVDYTERDAARRAIDAIDNFAHNLSPDDVIAGDPIRANAIMGEARANYAAFKRSGRITEAIDKANRQAAKGGSGANIDNATRQQIDRILNNPKLSRGFSKDELKQMESIVRGTKTGNVARLFGKLAPRGVVSGALSGGPAMYAGGVPGLMAAWGAGEAGKFIGDQSTKRGAKKLAEKALERSPLVQDLLAQYQQNLVNPGLISQVKRVAPLLPVGATYGLLQQRF